MSSDAPITFLLAAHRLASAHDYFPWRAVGRLLGWDEQRSKEALWSLEADLLITGSLNDETRLLPEGRRIAERKLQAHPSGRRASRRPGIQGAMRKR